ncbi:MAG: PKD domain-containing protein [Chitinophagaceae bacterium]|nr:MAG: PKD domain-containing protein [Chitinophagaceae bacterium]
MRRALFLIVVLLTLYPAIAQKKKASGTGQRVLQTQAHDITPASPGFCPGGSVSLAGSPSVPGHAYQWTLNNVNIPGATSIAYTANAIGAYSLFAYTATDTIYFDTVNVVQYALPVPAFSSNPSGQCSSTPVAFTNTSTGAASYNWNFGDPNSASNTSTAAQPTHTFVGSPGNGTQNFSVQLTVTSANGCQATTTATVTTKQMPDATLNGTGSSTYNNLPYFKTCANATTTFHFLNASTTNNTSYSINWGDGSPVFTAASFTTLDHDYTVGPHTMVYTVMGANGCVTVKTYYVFVGNNPAVGIGNPGNTNICTGSTLTFPLTGTGSNPTGTIYTVTFNEPSPSVVTYDQSNVPVSVPHQFDFSSCGTTSSDGVLSYPNSFSARIVAENPCGISAGSIVPIYVSQKPTVTFDISPKDTICLNTAVLLSSVVSSNYVDGTSCQVGKAVWSISPSTGWSLTSGSLGNTFNSNNIDFWTSGSATLGLSFSATGTYTIMLKTGNPKCGMDSFVRTICVNPNPVGSFTLDQNLGCAPFTVGSVNGSNTPICGGNTYAWSVSYGATAGCSPSGSDFIYVGGTTAASDNPAFQFNHPGVYTVQLVTKNSGGVCSAPAVSKTVTVKAKPTATINSIQPICAGQAINPATTISCYTSSATHSWGFPGGVPGNSNSASPGPVVYATAGSYIIYDTVLNECGATPVQLAVDVSEQPDFALPVSPKVCPASTAGPFSFTSSVSNTTFTWTNSNTSIGLASSGNGTIPSFTATNATSSPITATITVKATKGTCTTTKTFTITVWNKPAAPAATTPVTYCQNAPAVALTATALGSHHLLWYPGALLAAPTPGTGTAGNTQYQVAQVNDTTGCESNKTTITVTVNASPVITTVTPSNPTSCASSTGSLTIAGLGNGTYTVSYTRNGGAPVTASRTAVAGNIVISSLAAGTYDNITVTINGCTSNSMGPITLSDPNPPATPTATVGASPLCAGGSIALSASSSTGGVTYTWSGPNFSLTNTTGSASIAGATPAASGTYSVTATLAGCSSGAGTVDVLVEPKPATPSISAPAVCSGQTLALSANSSTPGVTYSWSGPNAFNDNTATPSIPNAAAVHSGTYTVTATLGNCSSTASVVASVKPTPVISATATQPTSCGSASGSIVISGLAAGTYAISYEKNSSPVTATQTIAGSTLTIGSLTAGTYTNLSVSLDGCPSNIVGPFVLTDPNPPAAPQPAANGPICSGSDLQLSINAPVAGNYSWTGPNSFSSSQQAPLIAAAGTAATGTYSVTVTVSGCTSPTASVAVVVNQTPAQPMIASNSPVCSGNALNLSATTATPGAIVWSWTGPNAFSSSSASISFPAATAGEAGAYTVTATLGTCRSDRSSTVVVKPTPQIALVVPANPGQCASSTGSLTLQGLDANTLYNYSYTRNAVANTGTETTNASGQLVIGSLSAGTYDAIVVTLNGCSSAAAGPFTLSDPNPPATPVASTGGAVCSGTPLQLHALSATSGVTYSWSGPNSFTSTSADPVIATASLADAGTYSVTATLNGCTSAAGTVLATVNESPATPTASSPAICSGSNLVLNASSTTAAVGYSWSGPNGFISTQQNPVIANATTNASGTYTVTATLGSCSSSSSTIAVVKPTPSISGSFNNPTSCASATGSISLQTLAPGSYTVQYLFNANPATAPAQNPNASGVLTLSALVAGTYSNISVTLDGCPSNAVGPFVLTDPNPPAAPSVGSNSPLCSDALLQLTASPVANATYSWTGPAGFNSTAQSPSIANATVANAGVYSVTVTVSNCTSQPATVTVVVHPLPPAPGVSSPVAYCKDVPASALQATAQTGATLNWYNAATGGPALPAAPVPATATPASTSWFVSQTSADGCEGPRAQLQVVVHPDADARFTFARDTACWPFDLPIQNTSTAASNGSYAWYANGILFSSGSATLFPGYVLPNPSQQVTIKLVAVSAYGCKPDSTEHPFITLPKPSASFSAWPTTGCGPLSVTFNNTTALIDTFRYSWDFGNGQISNQQQPGTVVFNAAPTANDTIYVVKLRAFNECDTSLFTMDIRVSSKPKALFTPDRTIGCSPMQVLFTNNSLGFGNTYSWNFDDGTVINSTSQAPVSHTFNTGVRDTFYVKLYATNACGIDSAVYSVVVLPNPIRLFMAVNGTQQNGCAPHTVAFINNSSGATGFQWTFGDGNALSTTANIDTVTHVFATPGSYSVRLTAFNGCTDTTMTLQINVYARPDAAFSADRVLACLGDTIHFTNNSVDATSYAWTFGDGGSSNLTAPAHVYSSPGIYTVTLEAQRLNPTGSYCSDTARVTVEIRSSFPGRMTVSDSVSTCQPFTVTFTDPNGQVATSTWNFGDGNFGAGSPVAHTYNAAGVYTASLTSVSTGGCIYTAQKQIRVLAPAGSFAYPSGYICGGQAVRFDATVSGTDTLIWNFGNGVTQATLTPFVYYTYPNPGLFVPSVVLASTAGCHVPRQGVDTIRVDRMVTGYTAAQIRFCGSTRVTFNDTSHVYFGIREVRWDFGDGNNAIGAQVTHDYASSGNYNIQQIIFSNSGCSDTIRRTLNVTVSGIPVASIVAQPQACARITTTLLANVQSVDPITLYEWSVNGTVQSSANIFPITFNTPGSYAVRLVVGTVNGCFDTAYYTMVVNPTPVVTASPDAAVCYGGSTQLNATGNGVLQWNWTPIQGLSCTTCANPLATPNTTTPYIVTGTNSFGCPGSDTVVITVHGPISITVSDDDTICIGQSVQLLASGAASYVWHPDQYLDNDSIPNPIATPPATIRYQVVGYDGWNCFTDTADVVVAVGQYPTANLGPDLVLATGVQRPLVTTVTNGPIRNWLWAPASDLSCSTCPLPTATIRNDVLYTVQVTNNYGCAASDTLFIKAFCKEAQVFLPNAFSPDGDGVNDVFMVQGSGILRVKTFRIFNRWGELVFEKNEVPPNDPRFGWDGRVIGRPAIPDVYVYTVEVLCENGTPYTYKGNVTILK